MAAAALQVVGLAEVRRTMRKLEVDTADLKDAHAAAAQTVASAAAARAPRRTGKTAASIKGNRAVGRATVRFGGASAPGAGPVHYGWPAHHIAENPFVIDAAQATETAWMSTYEHALADVVDQLT